MTSVAVIACVGSTLTRFKLLRPRCPQVRSTLAAGRNAAPRAVEACGLLLGALGRPSAELSVPIVTADAGARVCDRATTCSCTCVDVGVYVACCRGMCA